MNPKVNLPKSNSINEAIHKYALLERCKQRIASGEARDLRVNAGLTQRDLAALVGCAISTVCNWETGGRNPGPGLGLRYAKLLDRLAAGDDITKDAK